MDQYALINSGVIRVFLFCLIHLAEDGWYAWSKKVEDFLWYHDLSVAPVSNLASRFSQNIDYLNPGIRGLLMGHMDTGLVFWLIFSFAKSIV